jgi:DNA-binding MarR family transcriptional regulator
MPSTPRDHTLTRDAIACCAGLILVSILLAPLPMLSIAWPERPSWIPIAWYVLTATAVIGAMIGGPVARQESIILDLLLDGRIWNGLGMAARGVRRGSMYVALDRLESKGYVISWPDISTDAMPPRRLYRITPAGRAAMGVVKAAQGDRSRPRAITAFAIALVAAGTLELVPRLALTWLLQPFAAELASVAVAFLELYALVLIERRLR